MNPVKFLVFRVKAFCHSVGGGSNSRLPDEQSEWSLEISSCEGKGSATPVSMATYGLLLVAMIGLLTGPVTVSAVPGDQDDDGVSDINDIDDDNDGITDVMEELLIPVLNNPSFETFTPALATKQWVIGTNGYHFNEADVPGWSTTAPDGQIEIWESTFSGVPSQSGSAHMEINANQDALLYQSFATEGGDIVHWSIWHRGRGGIDTASVQLGASLTSLTQQDIMITGTNAWINYSGIYVVPDGQTQTLIAFESISTGSGSAGSGNFIDNLQITRTADTDLDSSENHIDLDSDNDGISDLEESGTTAANIAADTDYNGTVTLAEAEAVLGAGNADVDGDGLMDIFDLDLTSIIDTVSVGTVPRETDASISDYKDQDSDDDGIPDTVEGRLSAGYVANDADITDQDLDSDGVIDLFDANDASTADFGGSFVPPVDTDMDDLPDYLDTDSDSDTLLDSAEIAVAYTATFQDPDGAVTTTMASLMNVDTDASDVDFRSVNDSDGDGVADINDPAPADNCVPNPGGLPLSKDCDGDGNPAATDPNPSAPNAADDAGSAGLAIDILANDDFLPNNNPDNLGSTAIAAVAAGSTCLGTSVFDATTGSVTYTPDASETSGSCDLEYEVCSATSAGSICDIAIVEIANDDTDGDGIPDALDIVPLDPCMPNVNGLPGTKDCDGDGNPASSDPDGASPNASDDAGAAGSPIDILGNDDFLSNSDSSNLGSTTITGVASGSTCIGVAAFDAAAGSVTYTPDASETAGGCDLVYQVCSTTGSVTVCETATVEITNNDSDGDGVPDSLDSDPADACVPNMSGLPGSKDCDGDGNPASTDPSPALPDASDDLGSAGVPIDLLGNDDFLPNNDPNNLAVTTLTGPVAGGTCTGSASFDAQTGFMTYTPAATELTGSCALLYEVCSGSVCETATVTIALQDSDSDGIPDSLDADPSDPCIPNVTGVPGFKDCDADGNPASTDPDPSTPSAIDDAGAPGTPIDILSNDDFLPNNNPLTGGTTTIVQSGGTCTGAVAFDADTGSALYTAGAGDTGATCVIEYTVCSDAGSPATCEIANITITNVPTQADSDNDGIPDAVDLDDDNDGIPDAVEGSGDTDGDGIPDHLDLDSDNDGLTDAYEAGGTDADGDGVIDGFSDNDADGLDDATAASPLPVPDTDGDSAPDYLDFDADNDGISDIIEAGGVDVNGDGMVDSPADANGDGLDDATAASPLPDPDTDGDGIVDHLELDSDNDGIPDALEGTVDTDGDGAPDYLDLDSDNDGIPDSVEAGLIPNQPVDTDGDGIPDFRDLDSDADGEVDSNEAGSNPAAPVDLDGNGIPDYQEPPTEAPGPVTDSDGDGIPDAIEGTGDTDGDGIPDYLDIDADNDGILDSTELTQDADADGIPDYLDLDSDNDGLTDTQEAGGPDVDADGIVDSFTDTDGNGLADSVDASALPEADTDGDGLIDYLDLDSDNDGLPDVYESVGPRADANSDGRVDDTADADGNGLVDNVAINALVDSDDDLIPDHLEVDRNNDGIMDLVEAGGADVDGDGQVDTWQDDDFDGVPNTVDADFTGGTDVDGDGIDDRADVSFLSDADTDGDGIADPFDADFQGDGFVPFSQEELKPDDGIIHIGLAGNGCSIGATYAAGIDPTLPLLSLLSLCFLGLRRSGRCGAWVLNRGHIMNRRSAVVAIAASAAVLQACSPFDRTPLLEDSSELFQDSYIEEQEPGLQRHVYAVTGVGASWLEPDTSEVDGVDVNDRVNPGGQIALGIDATKHLSFELHSADLGSAGLSPSGRINYHMHGGSALLYLGGNRSSFKREGLTGYGRLGYGTLDDSPVGDVDYVEDNGNHVLIGGGVEYMTRLGVGVRAEVISFDADVKYGQLALMYRLGRQKRNEEPIRVVEAAAQEPVPMPVIQVPVAAPTPDACAQFDGVLEGVNFHSDSAQLTGSAQTVLDSVAFNLSQCAGVPVEITAHTDSQGSEAYNQNLSHRRAISVAKYLFVQGIDVSRMRARAFGETRPIRDNATAEGRAQNRRVELIAQ